ncbi:MAG: nuclear transport factor 2 family protein, partial [Acidobacteria bacterium]|nr:nuclear transport factor 2 family protein [Acidobacteriota bacterium]
LDRLLAEGWTVTHGNGTMDTKAQYLADLKSGDRKFSADVKEGELTVRISGDTAVASGLSDSKVTFKGQVQGGPLRFTRVYVRRDGRWVMIVSHATSRKP